MFCRCELHKLSAARRIVLTGGPGAGKTAILELARKEVCSHVAILPEAAGIIFSGGFWRRKSEAGRKSAQRAIYHVQRESEALVDGEGEAALMLCDRGTLDGLAYWPSSTDAYFKELGTTREIEMARYAVVIHLQTPTSVGGYNNINAVRIETAEEAALIDRRIREAWNGHPHRHFISAEDDFLNKAKRTLDAIFQEVPACCRPVSA